MSDVDIEALTGGDASDFADVIMAIVNSKESITSGADPVAADPDVAFTQWTPGVTKGTEIATLADPTDPTKPFVKRFVIGNVGADTLVIRFAHFMGSSAHDVTLSNPPSGSPMFEAIWNPLRSEWQSFAGASGTGTVLSSITVANGIVTAITVA